jgi:predicted negative regulator of RcsB-dependent stress response/DNA-binding CsgD family transcriptional regulator
MRKALIAMIGMMLLMVMTVSQSCTQVGSRDTDHILTVAEELMESSPDSVLALLSDPALRPGTDRQKALYALLLTQARHKNYIDETNDSLIATAVDYFDRKGDEQRLMKSLFYHATINSNASNYPAAMTSAMRALKLAEQLNDTYWQARIAEIIGLIFADTYFYNEAVVYYDMAAENFRKTGITKAYLYSLADMAAQYNFLNMHNMSLTLIDSIKSQSLNPHLLSYCAVIACDVYFKMGELNKAEEYIDTILKYQEIEPISSSVLSRMANVKIALGKMEEAEDFLDASICSASSQVDSLAYNIALVNFHNNLHESNKVKEVLYDIFLQQDNIARDLVKQSAVTAQRNYYSSEAILEREVSEMRFYIILLIVTLSCLVVTTIILLFRNRIERKNAEINENVAQLLYLKDKLSSTTEKKNAFSKISQTLFSEKLNYLNLLINEYYESDDSLNSQKVIYKNIKKEIAKLIDNKNISEIERIIDACGDGIMQKMRSQLPFLSSEDTDLIVLTLAGYSGKAISLFLNMKLSTVYVTRKRIIDKIAASDAMDRDCFVAMLRNPDFR